MSGAAALLAMMADTQSAGDRSDGSAMTVVSGLLLCAGLRPKPKFFAGAIVGPGKPAATRRKPALHVSS